MEKNNNMEKAILIKKDKPPVQILLLAVLTVITGSALILAEQYNNWRYAPASILLVTGILLMRLHSVLYYVPAENQLRTVWQSLFLRYVQKEKLPTVSYIAAVNVRQTHARRMLTLSGYETRTRIRLNLIFSTKPLRYRSLGAMPHTKALATGQQLADRLGVKFYDKT